MKKTLLLLFSTLLFFSCSVKYEETVRAEDAVPEFIFSNVELTRFEKNKISVSFSAEQLEQYKNSSESYAKKIEFSAYDDKGKLSTEGSCDLLSANTDTEVYTLFDNIEVFSSKENSKFYADSLKWNAKSEQLTSDKSDTIKIEKDDAVIYGSGFSASGISKIFRFSSTVSGEINTKDQDSTSLTEKKNE